MKNIFLLLISLIAFQNLSFAAFPVLESYSSAIVAAELPIDSRDNMARKSMILASIATGLTILVIVLPGYSKILPLFAAILLYGLAFIYGIFGLWSKTKKWQAFIGIFSWVFLALVFVMNSKPPSKK